MQSTGGYWLPVYEILTEEGLQVFLVNARHTKNLPGRKTDVQECQWLLQLHTFGLLNNSFRPPEEIGVLRAYWRQRAEPVATASTCLIFTAIWTNMEQTFVFRSVHGIPRDELDPGW